MVLFVFGIALCACLIFVVVRGFVLIRMLVIARVCGRIDESGEDGGAKKDVLGEAEWDAEMGLLGGEEEEEAMTEN